MFKSGKNPETWVGMDAFLAVLCFNTAEADKDKKAKPRAGPTSPSPSTRTRS
jgi:iron(III) transport system substrate-binding protein